MEAKTGLDARHAILFSMLGGLMFLSKQALEFLPNVELVSTLTMVYTLVYRKWALIPVFLFIGLEGTLWGFSTWWIPYLYLWPILWGVTMLLPRQLPARWGVPVYAVVCALFGLAYGTLYAPFQCYAFLQGDWKRTLTWIAAGFPWDAIHAAGNLALGTLIVPLSTLLRILENRTQQ